jgi:MFS family permease
MTSLPAAVWRLMLAYALMMAGTPMMVLIAGIIGMDFAPSQGLATLPIALVVVGVALSTLPTGRLLARWGRRRVFLGSGGVAICAAVFAASSLMAGSFAAFCAAAFLTGWAAAAGHQYRFAALELVPAEAAPRATSMLLLGGILAAFIGPEMAVAGRNMLETEYAGSYLLLVGGYLAGMVLIGFNRDLPGHASAQRLAGRPLREIMTSPVMVLAIAAAALGYAVMSFIMTATPISMHRHAGHSLESTKFVIQSHIVAMYLPAVAYAWLQARMGYSGLLWAAVVIYGLCLGIALVDTGFLHYWVALVLLGIGWNFLFLTGTNLLPTGYRPEERFKVQSVNDFVVFSVQATVSLSSGWFLFRWGWSGVLWTSLPMVLLFAALLWQYGPRLPSPSKG